MSGGKKTKGLTLVEIIIAMAVLIIVTAPIIGMFVMGTRISVTSYKMNIASFTAQMSIEELMGLDREEIEDEIDLDNGIIKHYNGFHVKLEIAEREHENKEQLILIRATVYDTDYDTVTGTGSVLCQYEQVIETTGEY